MNAPAKVPPAQITPRYDEMCRAIAAAYDVDEVKGIRDKALALQTYAALAHNIEAERQAGEIRLRAERRAGQLLAEMQKAKGGQPTKNPSWATTGSSQQTLADLGISHDQSSRWQKLAEVPEQAFEEAVTGAKRPTTTGIIAANAPPREPKVSPVDSNALWLWGRLLDFEREGLLADDPNRLLGTMLDHMRATTLELAPKVAAWLWRLGASTSSEQASRD